MKWVLTPDEFAHVWATETGSDYRPYPVHTIPDAESDRGTPGLRQQYARNTDPDLTAALLLCARPNATTLTASGERSVVGADRERILAFAAVAQQHAGILVARPESVVVLVCHAQAVGEQLVRVIGSAPAGRHRTMREAQDAVLDPDLRALLTNAARFQHTLRAPVDSRGIVTVTIAPHNPTPPTTRHRTWLDVAGDGRYLLTTAEQLTLTPVDDTAFAAHLMRLAGLH